MSEKSDITSRSLPLGRWYFQVRIKFTIFTLLAIIILVYLGTWQLARSMQKKELINQMEQKLLANPVRLPTIVDPQLAKNRFTPVMVYGTYLNKYTFLLDNQVFEGQVGYRVLTVFQSPHLEKWVLIDRGWIEQGKSRKQLPLIHDVFGVQELIGIINTIPTGILLKSDPVVAEPTWPIVIQSLDYDFMTKNLHHPIYDFLIQIRASDSEAYKMPPIDFGMPSDKHLGYAFQWYGFAVLVFVYYLITSLSRHRR